MQSAFLILAVIFVSFQPLAACATSQFCFNIFPKNSDTATSLKTAFETEGVQKVIHVAPNLTKNLDRILNLISARKKSTEGSGLSIIIIPSHSNFEWKKESHIRKNLPNGTSVFKMLDHVDRGIFLAFLNTPSATIFVEANLINSFLKNILAHLSEVSGIVFDGVYLDEKPELVTFLSRPQLDEFLLQTNSILYAVSTGTSLQQRERVTNYQTVFFDGHKLVSPEEFINLPYTFMTPKKQPRRHFMAMPWDDFYKLVKGKKFVRRKEFMAWVETEKPPGVPLHPHIAYANDWKGWEHLLGSKWLSFEDARKVAIAAGLKNQSDFLAWTERPYNFPSYPKGVYPEFTTWAEFLVRDLRPSPRLIQILPYEEALPVASAWARENNIQTLTAYRERKDKPQGLPREPEKIYKGKGWVSADVFFGLVSSPSGVLEVR